MRITSVASTEMFIGDPRAPRQIVQVAVDDASWPLRVEVTGEGVSGSADLLPAQGGSVEVGVACTREPGTSVPIEVTVHGAGSGASVATELVVAEPGWTVWMVPHFHYDPVFWATQAAYTATWAEPGEPGAELRLDFQQPGFALVRAHLETARRDADYKFVLAELDYLKPYWDARPQDREYLRQLIGEGRVELVGGMYNEPSTNLTTAESTVRNLVYGAGFQREILGGDPRTAWQLDVFGHDPQFPGLVADAGMDSSSWARGPFHQWGPMLVTGNLHHSGWGDPSGMQFPAEFEWLSPSGKGVLTHYMPAHYWAGWWVDARATLAEAETGLYELFLLLKKVAATRNVLLPMGTDYSPPAHWVTEIHRDWNSRYVWPRFVCGLPNEFFAAVRAQLHQAGRAPVPQTRDMNPIYTGKDVSFVDTKQAQRHAEALLVDAEKFATIAATLGAEYPHAAIDKAWRLLLYGAHHDAITGSESDQVYLDLLTGWRQAYDLARGVLDAALRRLTPQQPGGAQGSSWRVVVFNPSSWPRADLVRCRIELPAPGFHGVSVHAMDSEASRPVLLENSTHHADGSLAAADVVFRADGVPSLGYRTWRLVARTEPGGGWQPVDTLTIENQTYRLAVDPARGGAVCSLEDLRTGRTLLQPGRVGNELLVYDEYPAHPVFHEGPWHLLPKGGPVAGSAGAPAESVRVLGCPIGQRVIVTGRVGPLRYTQQLTLWDGIERIDATTQVDEFTGADHLVRLRWPMDVPGALPVSEVGNAVVGRGFALIDVDAQSTPWTLDNPAQHWFGLSATGRVELVDPQGRQVHTRAIGVAEIITAPDTLQRTAGRPPARDLAIALVRQGVTATCSSDTGSRYGNLAIDSNLPDVRIAIGGPADNAFTARVLAAADPQYADEVARQLARTGRARVWVPATRPLSEVWVPGADLTDPRALPVLVVVDERELAIMCAEVNSDAVIRVTQPASLSQPVDPQLAGYTVGLINRGVPGFAVDTTGALHLSLMRSCTGWPSGVWTDPPRRTAPDGSNFQQQHWTHGFDYALVTGEGDWRSAGLVPHGHDVNHPLVARLVPGSAAVPHAHSFLSVEPAGQVVLAALKPAGYPLATGQQPDQRVARVTARVYEANGRRTHARIRMWAPVTAASTGDVLDRPIEPVPHFHADIVEVPLAGATIGHLLVDLAPPTGPGTATGAGPAAVLTLGEPIAAEPDQPVYARYWLNNAGPAPIGNMPLAVHVDPLYSVVEAPVTLTVTVASDRTDEVKAGLVRLVAPEGWSCEPAELEYELKPGAYAEHAVVVTPPHGVSAGTYWLCARMQDGEQVVEDVARLLVGQQRPETVTATPRTVSLRLRPGQTASIDLDLATDAATPIAVHAWLVSPWQTWEMFPTPIDVVEIPARSSARLSFPVAVPPTARPGRWWALAKLAHAGQLQYAEPVEVEVLPT